MFNSDVEKNRTVILGTIVGDAVGVPYEFIQPEWFKTHPATEMVGGCSHKQPIGTWSDDGSMTLNYIPKQWIGNIADLNQVNEILEKSGWGY